MTDPRNTDNVCFIRPDLAGKPIWLGYTNGLWVEFLPDEEIHYRWTGESGSRLFEVYYQGQWMEAESAVCFDF